MAKKQHTCYLLTGEAKKRWLFIAKSALGMKYTVEEVEAALEFYERKNRLSNPPGEFDRLGRFYADERTHAVRYCVEPTKRYPYSEMLAARTAEHCAELHHAQNLTFVRRLVRAMESDKGKAEIKKLLAKDQKERDERSPDVIAERKARIAEKKRLARAVIKAQEAVVKAAKRAKETAEKAEKTGTKSAKDAAARAAEAAEKAKDALDEAREAMGW